jgi:dTMP kinase
MGSTRRGFFVTFEGIEGVGKSTQLERAAAVLVATGRSVTKTREPGGTPVAERLREVVLAAGRETIVPAAELMIMAAARAQHTAHVIRPALERDEVVLCDRYVDATYAYQGGGRGVEDRHIGALMALATGDLVPDLTLLFDAPVVLALGRARRRGGSGDRIEAETVEFFERVRARYLARARAEPDRFRLVDATLDEGAVAAQVDRHLGELVGGLAP